MIMPNSFVDLHYNKKHTLILNKQNIKIMTNLKMVKTGEFNISKKLITQEIWKRVMGEMPVLYSDKMGKVRLPYEGDAPICFISHIEALEFIEKLNAQTGKNYRLPTEAEWEFAARGGYIKKGDMWEWCNCTMPNTANYIDANYINAICKGGIFPYNMVTGLSKKATIEEEYPVWVRSRYKNIGFRVIG